MIEAFYLLFDTKTWEGVLFQIIFEKDSCVLCISTSFRVRAAGTQKLVEIHFLAESWSKYLTLAHKSLP